jgi:hypothetical protein
MENKIIKQLKNIHRQTGLQWKTIADEIGINHFTLCRLINNKGRNPIPAHEKLIKKYLKKHLTYVN